MAKTISKAQIREISEMYNYYNNQAHFYLNVYNNDKKDKNAEDLYEKYADRRFAIENVMTVLGFEKIVNKDARDLVDNNQTWVFVKQG